MRRRQNKLLLDEKLTSDTNHNMTTHRWFARWPVVDAAYISKRQFITVSQFIAYLWTEVQLHTQWADGFIINPIISGTNQSKNDWMCPRGAQTCMLPLSSDNALEINPTTLKLKGDLDILKTYLHSQNKKCTDSKLGAWTEKTCKQINISQGQRTMSKGPNYFQCYHNNQVPAVSDK